MHSPFLVLYNWFARRRWLLFTWLVVLLGAFGWMASQVRFDENISSFFGDQENPQQRAVFENLKVKDKLVVIFSGDDPDRLIEQADSFAMQLQPLLDEGVLRAVVGQIDQQEVARATDFVYDHLPLLLDEAAWQQLEQAIEPEAIDAAMARNFDLLTSPSGAMVAPTVMRDPLMVGGALLQQFETFGGDVAYEIYADHLFSEDLQTLFILLEPAHQMGNTGANERLVIALEETVERLACDDVAIACYGAALIAVHNARCIKHDTLVTLSLALVVILLVIGCSFRSRRAIPLLITLPLFGALFALAMVYWLQGSISAIAIGAGAVVLGVALSYSIHVIAHLNHTSDPRTLIRDLAEPLTVGCLTTIGAFVALLYTHSQLLHDLGLFAALTLVGTTLFCLIFLPHLVGGGLKQQPSRLLRAIERGNGYAYERNRWVLLVVGVATCMGLFFYDRVAFDGDMSHINYLTEELKQAEAQLKPLTGAQEPIYLVTTADDQTAVIEAYRAVATLCDSLQQQGIVATYASAVDFVVTPDEQQQRLARWQQFWQEHGTTTVAAVEQAAVRHGFRAGAFEGFRTMVERDYTTLAEEAATQVPLLSDWIDRTDERVVLVSRLSLPEEQKAQVYAAIEELGGTTVVDRAYFTRQLVTSTSEDFNYILWISSLIVFVALLITYGRIELAVMCFLPMCLSWVIILGLMALCEIRFNIVNVILATFIFGIGDDFSIFIMDGLMEQYRSGKRMLGMHKTAIFFSAFTTLVGMGVLIFAEHPALRSMALISVVGLSAVVLVSYTVQPLLFRWLITSHTERGGFPFTALNLFNTFYSFLYFLLGCIVAHLFLLVLWPLPMARRKKKLAFHYLIYGITRLFLNTVSIRPKRLNPHGERFDRPAVIIANHQSILDILLLLSTTPRLVVVTNSWVWNSPVIGRIVRYADSCHAADGYEKLVERLRDRVAEGYSVLVFPEGTRSLDGRIGRFHKGAFYLAETLQIDLLPMVIYGTGQVATKHHGCYIKDGLMAIRTLPRVAYDDPAFGVDNRSRAKAWRHYFEQQYSALYESYTTTENRYFRDALIKNFLYKGPIVEWYVRIKARSEQYYALWHRLVPKRAVVTDVGCGYGMMGFMLGMLSEERTILGIDYDQEKIELAAHSLLAKTHPNVRFAWGDMRTVELPRSDVFLVSDSLHYLPVADQELVLERVLEQLNDGGKIIVRDGDSSNKKGQAVVEQIERWSTRILRFNKREHPLEFVSREWMEQFARRNGLHLQTETYGRVTSEMIYIFEKK